MVTVGVFTPERVLMSAFDLHSFPMSFSSPMLSRLKSGMSWTGLDDGDAIEILKWIAGKWSPSRQSPMKYAPLLLA